MKRYLPSNIYSLRIKSISKAIGRKNLISVTSALFNLNGTSFNEPVGYELKVQTQQTFQIISIFLLFLLGVKDYLKKYAKHFSKTHSILLIHITFHSELIFNQKINLVQLKIQVTISGQVDLKLILKKDNKNMARTLPKTNLKPGPKITYFCVTHCRN